MREIEQMVPLIEQIINSGNANHILSDRQIARLLGGSNARRYGQVNRALKTGELVRVRRGLYLLSDRYREFPAHPFVVASSDALFTMPGICYALTSALLTLFSASSSNRRRTRRLPGRSVKMRPHILLATRTIMH